MGPKPTGPVTKTFLAAFVFLATAMIIAAALIITAGPGSARRAGDMRRKARPFPG